MTVPWRAASGRPVTSAESLHSPTGKSLLEFPLTRFFAGLKSVVPQSVVPMLIGAIPFGVIYGVVAIGAGVLQAFA